MQTQDWPEIEESFGGYLITRGMAAHTRRTYLGSFKLFWVWCRAREADPSVVDRAAIRRWVGGRLQSASSQRCHVDLAALRHYYAYLLDIGLRADDPTDGIRVKRSRQMPTRPLTAAEVHALIEACDSERDRLIVMTLLHTGMRIAELASLTAKSIDWHRGYIVIRGKGDKERLVAPPLNVLERLHAFVGMFPVGSIWRSYRNWPLKENDLRKIIYAIALRAKVDDVHPHRFRATFATEFLERYPDIQALQAVLGHESIETTARYTEWTRNRRGLEHMRKLAWD